MQYSHSRIECFEKCKFKYKMRYLEGVTTDPATDADNALILGTAVHTGIESGLEAAIQQYSFSFPILTDAHVNEIIKLESVIPRAREEIPKDGKFEVPIFHKDFRGFIDYLVPCDEVLGDAYYDLYDFKYTGNPLNYRDSPQLHLYKYFFERCNPGKKIRKMFFLFVPKSKIRQKKTETLQEYRERLKDELAGKRVKIETVSFDYTKVIDFLLSVKATKEEKDFPKAEDYLCRWCEFEEFCMKGWDYFMKLPENKRRSMDAVKRRVIWIYGAPFCGKTTFANGFPDPLMLNTDGNIKFVDAPYIRIRDEVKVEGRITKRIFAWENFKDTITELEKKDNTFKTIVVDLLEDVYEHCRLYMYNKLNISHESDDPFKAWDKVRGEFLNTLKRLMNLDYENIILISHEDATRDLTRKSGDKISAIKPNLADKVAVKVAGMVDVVARIVADGDTHTFNFKSNEVIFGGGRLKVNVKDIPLDVNALFAVYDEANANAGKPVSANTAAPAPRSNRRKKETPAETPQETAEASKEETAGENTKDEEKAPQEANMGETPDTKEDAETRPLPETVESGDTQSPATPAENAPGTEKPDIVQDATKSPSDTAPETATPAEEEKPRRRRRRVREESSVDE